jgi:hypothetical protein
MALMKNNYVTEITFAGRVSSDILREHFWHDRVSPGLIDIKY